jgi:hypothetical protein
MARSDDVNLICEAACASAITGVNGTDWYSTSCKYYASSLEAFRCPSNWASLNYDCETRNGGVFFKKCDDVSYCWRDRNVVAADKEKTGSFAAVMSVWESSAASASLCGPVPGDPVSTWTTSPAKKPCATESWRPSPGLRLAARAGTAIAATLVALAGAQLVSGSL